jgi:outer membrane murein-binding lipoprotein Lpp
VSRISAHRPPMGAALALVVAGAMLLGGCSKRDSDEMTTKLAAINAAADRAEDAAKRAEKAANDANNSQASEPEIVSEEEGPRNEPEIMDPNSVTMR